MQQERTKEIQKQQTERQKEQNERPQKQKIVAEEIMQIQHQKIMSPTKENAKTEEDNKANKTRIIDKIREKMTQHYRINQKQFFGTLKQLKQKNEYNMTNTKDNNDNIITDANKMSKN